MSLVTETPALRAARSNGRYACSTRSRCRGMSRPQTGPISANKRRASSGRLARGFMLVSTLALAKHLKAGEGLVHRHHLEAVDVHVRRQGRDPEQRIGHVLGGHGMGARVERVGSRLA